MTTRGMVAASVGMVLVRMFICAWRRLLAFEGYVRGNVEDGMCGGDCIFCIGAAWSQHGVESGDAVADVEFSCGFCIFA